MAGAVTDPGLKCACANLLFGGESLSKKGISSDKFQTIWIFDKHTQT